MKNTTLLPKFELEKPLWAKGHTVIGIDEVGRGCLAGPMVLGAVCFQPLDHSFQSKLLSLGINDSKKVSEKKRIEIASTLQTLQVVNHTVSVSVPTINSIGIMNAWRLAIVTLVNRCRLDFPNDIFTLLVDGQDVKEIPYKEEVISVPVVKGDSKSVAIASASIIAKVTRDDFMSRLSDQYPVYEWQRNKGYGTAVHRNAIKEHGITPWHRLLFVRSTLNEK